MTAEEIMRMLLTDAAVGRAMKSPGEPGVHHVEDVRANPDVPDFSACTLVLDGGKKIRMTMTVAP